MDEELDKRFGLPKCTELILSPRTAEERQQLKLGTLPKRRCGRPQWRDGFCVAHHPETVEERRQQRAEEAARIRGDNRPWWVAPKSVERLGESAIEAAIVLLVTAGYCVFKP